MSDIDRIILGLLGLALMLSPKDKGDLHCRRMPPTAFLVPQQNRLGQVVPDVFAAWPVVRPEHSCGEFRPRLDIPG